VFLESPSVTDIHRIQPGLIETMRSDARGDIPLLGHHLQRLHRSAAALHYACPLQEIERALLHAARAHPGGDWRLRLLLHPDGHFELHGQPLPARAHNLEPAQIVLATSRLHTPNPWRHHKTTHRPEFAGAHRWLQAHPEVFDCMFLNQHDELCEGSRSTVYLQQDGQWYTPPLACSVLPGIVRQRLLESGQVQERVLTRQALLSAQAWRVSNAVHGWVEAGFDGTTIPLPD